MRTLPNSMRRRARTRFAFLLAGALVSACSSCGDKTTTGADAGTQVDLAPVPEPEGLIGEIIIAKPSEAWARLRELGGPAVRLLPQSFGMLTTTLLGLPATTADYVDVDLPLTGAVIDVGSAEPAVVLAVHVKSGRELIARVSTGADAAYSARADEPNALTLLEPKPGKASNDVAIGVIGNYLIAARHSADLSKGGPFAARTLPKRPPPAEPIRIDLKKAALTGPIAKRAREAWSRVKGELEQKDQSNRTQHGGRAPDFGDPAAALSGANSAVEGLIAVLESSASGRIVIEPFPDRLDARVELEAEKSGAAQEMLSTLATGDAAPLLVLPNTVPVAVLVRTTPASRQSSAKTLAKGVADLFGDRMAAPERQKIEETLGQLASGRGDWETYGLLIDGEKGGLVYRGAIADAKAFDSGAKAFLRFPTLKPFSEPMRQFIGGVEVKQSTADIPGIPGKPQRTLLTVKPAAMRTIGDDAAKSPTGAKTAKAPGETQTIEALWTEKDGVIYGVMSTDAVPAFVAIVTAPDEAKKTHGADAHVTTAVKRVKDASFVLLVQPLRLNLGQSATLTPNSPVIASFGKTGQSLWLRLDADRLALEELVKKWALPSK